MSLNVRRALVERVEIGVGDDLHGDDLHGDGLTVTTCTAIMPDSPPGESVATTKYAVSVPPQPVNTSKRAAGICRSVASSIFLPSA